MLAEAEIDLADVDAIAATAGPGLIGGVMVGLVTAKGLALAARKPLIAVNHLEGHALSPMLSDPDLAFPYLLLLVSGGHCQLLFVEGVGRYRRLATTIDDAAGEAFDKSAKLLGLGFPGGPAVERAAADGDPGAVPLPRPLVGSDEPHFSFAGLKSAVSRAKAGGRYRDADIAASFQQAVVDCLVDRTRRAIAAADGATALVVAGGVAANQAIRDRAHRSCRGERSALRRPAVLAVHRQCGDDRLGGRAALRGGAGRRARRPGAGALAARSGRRAGARRRGEGMRIGVIGAGAWGTALAQVAAAEGEEVLLWAREARSRRGGQRRARKQRSSSRAWRCATSIRATGDLGGARRLRRLSRRHARAAFARRCSAGFAARASRSSCAPRASRTRTGLLMHEVARQLQPASPIAVLSGPTFAHEVAAGLPTAVTLAVEDRALGERLVARIARPSFRPYLSDDVAGAEVGGAVKNVLAIACGVVEGAGSG